MKEQSGWAWNTITMLPKVSVQVMKDYVEVSNNLLPNMFIPLILLQAYPKSKQYFTKPFPIYDDIADLLGNTHTTSFATNNRRQKPEASLPIQESSQTPALTQASTTASIAINLVLEAISLEMQLTQAVDSNEAVH
jgi:hypothetical protein